MIEFTIENMLNLFSSRIISESAKVQLRKEIVRFVGNTYERFRFAKNFLFRNEPVNFYDNYIPLTLKTVDSFVRLKNPSDIFSDHGKVAIVGNAGSGKTTFLKYLTLKTINEDNIIPIYIELRLFDSQRGSFGNYVASLISSIYISELKELFKTEKFLFLLDGFDEINFLQGEKIISEIQQFISRYNDNRFIISSRPGTNIESFNEFYIYEMADLNLNDIEIYVDSLSLSRSQKELFYRSLKEDSYFQKYLTTPLFLSIYIEYILKHENQGIPRHKTIFFRNILDTLFSKHDSVSKLGFIREKQSGLNRDELENIASILAFRGLLMSVQSFSKDLLIKELELIKRSQAMYFENDNLIFDLTISVNILIATNDHYAFPHVLIHEYLASLFIVRLPLTQKKNFFEKVLLKDKFLVSQSLLNFLFELDAQIMVKEYVIPKLEAEGSYSYRGERNSVFEQFIFEQLKIENGYHYTTSLVDRLKIDYRIDKDSDLDELFRI